ncbi:hypothetical protein HZA56_09920 [Candidatus Poribacteria bacterium]|nr:hypothetical protein [Candidatus Poribacteria bacterium]
MVRVIVAVLLVIVLLALVQQPAAQEKEPGARGEGCLGCHKGIETINQKMAAAWGADKKCEICHQGQPSAASELEAHAGLIANPGDLRVIDQTCGKCHSDYGEILRVKVQGIDDHVGRVMRSLMATAAGEIAGTRYLWNTQETRSAIHGVRAVLDMDHEQPEGAVALLTELPPASNSDADSLLRGACLRCHLWTEDKTTPGVFRPAGCSACHVLYGETGLSQSGDPAMPKDKPGHPLRHEITTRIPDTQCLLCHNDGGTRIGLSYVGLAVTDSRLGRTTSETDETSLYGARLMHVKPDVHYRRGIGCIDCHDSIDLHGDGNVYSHQEYQVGIRCESCHGSSSKKPTFRTERGDALANVAMTDGKPYLRTKVFEEEHRIPVVYLSDTDSSRPAGIWHKGHLRLECYTCHSLNVPQCYVCHMTRDDGRVSPVDWATGIGEGQLPRSSAGMWSGSALYQAWDNPILGIGRRDRISPFMPGGQAILDRLSSGGEKIVSNHVFKTSAGLYGFSMNPVQPHNISAESRTCPSCHSNKKTLGLGSDFADLKRLGLSLNFSPDSFVNEEGGRIQDSGHEGVRPFNGEELAGLLRTDSCIVCHKEPMEMFPSRFTPGSLKEGDRSHEEAIKKSFQAEKE